MNYRQKILNFIKYNNATIIILAVVLVIGGGVFAAGPEVIGEKQSNIQGLDNTALISTDLEVFNMDFKIENIQADEKYYYVTYSFLDLVLADNLWQYQLSQKTRKVSKKIKEDLGEYMAKFMAKHYEARSRALKQEKSLAESVGEQKRVKVTEYSGLIGKTLDLAAAVFPNYEPVVKQELPTPEFNSFIFPLPEEKNAQSSEADNLTKIYNDYVTSHPEIFETLTEPEPTDATSSPEIIIEPVETGSSTPDSETSTDIIAPEIPADQAAPSIPEPESVDIIELPLLEPTPDEEVIPVETPAPAEETPAPVESTPAEPEQ